MATTLHSFMDIFDTTFGENQDAVQLSVPGKSVKLAQQYSTKLVWTLEDTPNN